MRATKRNIAIAIVTVIVSMLVATACGGGEEETTTTLGTTTTVTAAATTTTAAGSGIVPGEDPDVDAIVEAYTVVFDNTTTFEEKAPYITDPTGLEDTVAAYATAGEAVGGIVLRATSVTVAGDTASVVYDFLFAGNPAYQGLEGDAVKTDAGWQVTREMFCGVMTSAQVGCPDQ